MYRLVAIIVLALAAGCAEDRCEVARRMNCEGLDSASLDQAYNQCESCSEAMSPAHREVSDCFVYCVANAIQYACDTPFWDDACALECTSKSTVEAARMELIEIETRRATLSACRG